MGTNLNEITAEWARKVSTTIMGEEVNKQLEICLKNVEKEVMLNKTSAYGPQLLPLVKSELIKRGFTIDEHPAYDQRDSAYVTIKW
jgi:hypothetical protein